MQNWEFKKNQTNKKTNPYFQIFWVGQKRTNKTSFFFRPKLHSKSQKITYSPTIAVHVCACLEFIAEGWQQIFCCTVQLILTVSFCIRLVLHQGPETLYRQPIQILIAPAAPSIIGARSSDEFYFLLVNSGQFMQFHVTCCLQARLLTNNMARKSITYWHCCCKPRPLFMRLVNLTYQLLHYIYIHFRTGFFLAMFSVSETPEDSIHFFEGAVTRMTILGSHVTDQIPSPKFRSRLYRRSLTPLLVYTILLYSSF